MIRKAFTLSVLFACEHCIRGGMEADAPVKSMHGSERGLPVYSLYAAARRMTGETLDPFDVLELMCRMPAQGFAPACIR